MSTSMVNEDANDSPASQLRKLQATQSTSPSVSHRSTNQSTSPKQTILEGADQHDEVYINGIPIENDNSALGADDAALGADDPQRRADPQERFLALMSALGCSQPTLEAIVSNGVDAASMATLCRMEDHETMKNELFMDSGLLRARVITKIHEIVPSQAAFSAVKGNLLDPVNQSSYRSSKEVVPTIPCGDAHGSILPTPTKWREYLVAIEGYLQLVGATQLAELANTLFKRPQLFKQFHQDMSLTSKSDQEIDLRWANEILVKASPAIKRFLSRQENITWQGKRSGSMMIASLSLLVMNRTQEQDTASLEQFLAYPSCDKAENLQKAMISFDNELERLIDSDFLINPQLEGHTLAKLTKVIRSQDRHKFDIALFWAQIPRTICHNTRVAQMRQIIQQTSDTQTARHGTNTRCASNQDSRLDLLRPPRVQSLQQDQGWPYLQLPSHVTQTNN